MGLVSVGADAAFAVCFVLRIISVKVDDFAISFKGEDMRGNAVEEPAVVRDDHGASAKIFKCVFHGAHCVHVEVICRFVQQYDIGTFFEDAREVNAVALAARELTNGFLLVGSGEVKAREIGTRIDVSIAQRDEVFTVRDGLPHIVIGGEDIAGLFDISEANRAADAECARVGLFFAGDEAKEGGFSRAIGADNADNAAGRQGKGEVFKEEGIAISFGNALGFDDNIAEARTGRNINFEVAFFFHALIEQLIICGNPRSGFGVSPAWVHVDPFALSRKGFQTLAFAVCVTRQPFFFLVEPRRVVAFVGYAFAAVEFEYPSGDIVEEIAVVRDGNDGARITL